MDSPAPHNASLAQELGNAFYYFNAIECSMLLRSPAAVVLAYDEENDDQKMKSPKQANAEASAASALCMQVFAVVAVESNVHVYVFLRSLCFYPPFLLL